MKPICLALLKRYGIILGVYPLIIVVSFSMLRPGNVSASVGAAGFAMLYLIAGLIWANSILVNYMSRLTATFLTAVLTIVTGSCVVMLTGLFMKLIGRR